MPFIGNQPALSYTGFAKQDFSTSATTSYTLDNPVANANELALFINFVRQEPTTAYSASGTTLTLTSATASSDDMYCVYLGKAVQTVNPPNNSVGASQLVDASITSGKLASGVLPTNTSEFLAYRGGSTQSGIADNVATKLQFNTESFDPDSVFDNSTNYRFTVPSSGKYMLYTNIFIYDGSTDIETFNLAFYKNGSKYSQAYWLKNSGGRLKYAPLSLTQVINLSASDYIEVYATVNTVDGGTTNLEHESTNVQNYFGGYKLIT